LAFGKISSWIQILNVGVCQSTLGSTTQVFVWKKQLLRDVTDVTYAIKNECHHYNCIGLLTFGQWPVHQSSYWHFRLVTLVVFMLIGSEMNRVTEYCNDDHNTVSIHQYLLYYFNQCLGSCYILQFTGTSITTYAHYPRRLLSFSKFNYCGSGISIYSRYIHTWHIITYQ
jgi:hypothetical protein